MLLLRIAGLFLVVTMLASCVPEPTASELAATAIANLRSAKTAHLDGTGSMAMKTGQAIPFSYDFTVSGDAVLPHNSRTNMQMVVNGVSLGIDTITVDGRDYTRVAGIGHVVRASVRGHSHQQHPGPAQQSGRTARPQCR